MISAFVLVNCHFPFDSRIKQEVSRLPFVSMIHRTEGRYDLIVRIDAETEQKLAAITKDIGKVLGVDATVSLTIAA